LNLTPPRANIRHDSLLKLEQARHAVPAAMAEIAGKRSINSALEPRVDA
jgi:hypothetical protein